MFFDLLSIKTPAWYQTFIDGRRLTSMYIYIMSILRPAHSFPKVYRKSRDFLEQQEEGERDITDKSVPQQSLKLTDQYLALLVIILTNAGLCQVRYKTNGKNSGKKDSPLTHGDSRHLPPCLKNQQQGLICHAKLHYSWPKSLRWQIGCYRCRWLPKFKYDRHSYTSIVKQVADCSIPGDTRSFPYGN